ncbi:putative Mediator of RNA polymerase II transcription subunit 27 [Hypsibius exemplaris]|uniref:Mediator of RNA polymerase II transcription subunit 27 n=1 Tax=Hypsibius exemplaris TaxID=2072580 RepID=A0A1W0WBV9_HYPEX|nr:putative Mediator of RNA polymerase II transcription subunit 27 [Hypsibius exemplaris]
MGDTTRNQLSAILDNLQEIENSLSRQNISLVDYRTAIQNAREEGVTVEDSANGLRRILENLDTDLRDIEKKTADTPSMISSLGLASFLCNVPSIGAMSGAAVESVNKSLYEELISTYSSTERSREYSAAAHNALAQYPFRRGTKPNLRPKRAESTEESRRNLERYIRGFSAMLPTLTFFFYDQPAMGTILEVIVDRIFRVVILLRGSHIEGVNVRGSEEQHNLGLKELRPIDLWTPSGLEVFRQLTRNAQAAMLHFQSPFLPESSLKNYLQWLNSLATLFSTPCRRCGKYLDNGLPPTFRDYKILQAYHEGCRILSFTPS